MKVPAHAFREYDIRGVAERDLTDDVTRAIGRGLATMIARSPGRGVGHERGRVRIAVGRDCRLSSERLFM